MKTIKELADAVRVGHRFQVQFKKKIEEMEAYPEGGMRARVIGMEEHNADSIISLRFDYAPYDSMNVTLESHNYYDRSGVACLTAREAGCYTVEEDIYFMADDPIENWMVILDDTAFLDEWNIANSGLTYVQWLEKELTELRERVADATADARFEDTKRFRG